MKNLIITCFLLTSLQGWSQNQFQNETVGSLSFYADQIMQLADAAPDKVYDWRPSEGVRSYGEVISHIISANYFFGTKMGASLPADVNMETLEKDLKTKQQLADGLKNSVAFVSGAIKGMSDTDLSTMWNFLFRESTPKCLPPSSYWPTPVST